MDQSKIFDKAKEILSEVDNIYKIVEKGFQGYSRGAKKVCAVLFKQTRSLFQAILLLYENNLLDEAQILTRSLTEVSLYLIFISDDKSEERVEWYRHSLALSEKVDVDKFNSSLSRDQPG